MSNVDEVIRMLRLAIGRLERAGVALSDVAAVQASRADIERVLAGLSGQASVYIANSTSVLRAAAQALAPILDSDVRAAWSDIVEAANLTEKSVE